MRRATTICLIVHGLLAQAAIAMPAGMETLRASSLIGGQYYDDIRDIIRSADGGYIVIGNTEQEIQTGRSIGGKDQEKALWDVFVAKLDGSFANVLWSVQFGGSGDEFGAGGCLDSDGDVVVVGSTYSADFPTTPGVYQNVLASSPDAFCVVLGQDDGTILRSTMFGGQSSDNAVDAVVDGWGRIIVALSTMSGDMPTSDEAMQRALAGSRDQFLVMFEESLASIVAATYIGGTDIDTCEDIVLDGRGDLVLSGWTVSSDYPVTSGAYDQIASGLGDTDAVIGKVRGDLSGMIWCTYLGAPGLDEANAVLCISDGTVCVGGETSARRFPVTAAAWDTSYNVSGNREGYVAVLAEDGGSLVSSTLLGEEDYESVTGLAQGPDGSIICCGHTRSSGFPTTGDALSRELGGPRDGFMVRFDGGLSNMLYGSFVGGSGDDLARTMCEDGNQRPVVCGYTASTDFPTTPGAAKSVLEGVSDGFVCRMSAGLALGVDIEHLAANRNGLCLSVSWQTKAHGEGLSFVVMGECNGWTQELGRVIADGRESYEVCLANSGEQIRVVWLVVMESDVAISRIGPVEVQGIGSDGELAIRSISANPCVANVQYQLLVPGYEQVSGGVFDARGRLVRALAVPSSGPGAFVMEWDCRDAVGRAVAGGVYYIRIASANRHCVAAVTVAR